MFVFRRYLLGRYYEYFPTRLRSGFFNMMRDLLSKLVEAMSFSVSTAEGRRRLEPVEFSLRVASIVTVLAVVICVTLLLLMSQFGLVTDLANGLMLGVVVCSTISFSVSFSVCWVNAAEVKVLIQSHERFAHLSHTDALTGLNNRLGLYTACTDLGPDYCVAFVDIDHFKSVNDRFSHLAGDAVIARVAQWIRFEFDGAAHLARMGGEEFVIVEETDPRAFLKGCERLRSHVETTPVVYQDMRICITISIGVAVRKDVEIFEKVLHDADLALYRAKGSGRNQVCIAANAEQHTPERVAG